MLLALKRRAAAEGRPLAFAGLPGAALLADLYGVEDLPPDAASPSPVAARHSISASPPTADAMPAAVEVVDVARRFGSVQALAGVSIDVEEGEFFGLLGPNGAGKTTLISIVAGLTRADRGTRAHPRPRCSP